MPTAPLPPPPPTIPIITPPPFPISRSRGARPDTRPTIEFPAELGKLIERDAKLVKELGWVKFVKGRRGVGDLTEMENLRHPARRLLRHYKFSGVPVTLTDKSWGEDKLREALQRGPHPSAVLHSKFLFNEFVSMINLDQWVVLPYSVTKT